jgi:hypothetical protein
MDFSGIYRQQTFYQKTEIPLMDFSTISGTNCYLDDQAGEELRGKIREIPVNGIHFLDSGNYHYMTRLWIEKIREPFRLLVLDNHTDMQPPAFGGLLSCGGWIASALEEVPMLKEVILVGPDEEAYRSVDPALKERVQFISREKLAAWQPGELEHALSLLTADLPFYLSVDKDVLSETELKTNWSQGDMKAETMLRSLQTFAKAQRERGGRILGMDVCGEDAVDTLEKLKESDRINQCLLDFWISLQNGSGR